MSLATVGSYSYKISPLASDAFGRLHEGEETRSGQTVYLKALSGRRVDADLDDSHWRSVSHPSFLAPHATFVSGSAAWAVLPKPEGSLLERSLPQLLARGVAGRHRLLSALADVCRAVEALHATGIVHGQINPSSVVLTSTEAGTQGILLQFDRFSPRPTSDYVDAPQYLSYVPQEQLRGGGGFQSDVYALAMLAHTSLGNRADEEEQSAHEIAERCVWGDSSPFVANLEGLARGAADALSADLETLAAVTAKGLQRSPGARYLTVGELRRALEELARRMAPFALGERLKHERRFTEAAAVFQEAAAGPQGVLALVFLGRTLGLDLGDHEGGIVAFRRALKAAPELDSARLGLAEIYLSQKRYAMAKHEYEQVLATRPDDCEVLTGYANVLRESGNPQGALNVLRKIHAGDPYHLPAYIAAIRLGLHHGMKREAEADSSAALSKIATVIKHGNLSPEEVAEVYYLRAVVLANRGAHDNAIGWAEKALALVPLHLESRKLLAELYSQTGRIDQAAEHFASLLQLDPEQSGILAALAKLLGAEPDQGPQPN